MRRELTNLAELAGLSALVIAQPVFEILGGAPEEMVIRGVGAFELVLLALILVAVPPIALWLVELVVERLAPSARPVVHAAFLGVLSGMLVLEIVKRSIGPRPGILVPLGLIVAGGVAATVLRWERARLLPRYLVFAPFLFVAAFLFFSPLSDIVIAADARPAEVEVGRPAPVVMIVLDELPLTSLLDGDGAIDAELYPNLAGLAAQSNWYRNHTTVAPLTPSAVPAIVTGQEPEALFPAPVSGAFPESLFTLLGGTYDVRAGETLTRVCPQEICSDREEASSSTALRSSLGLARDLIGSVASPTVEREDLTFDVAEPPGDPDPPQRFPELTASLGRETDRPTFDFLHVLMPHQPFDFVPSGARYDAPDPPRGTFVGQWVSDFAADAGRLRHALQLQLTDRLLGDALDRLRELGTYDESLIVVTADHGIAFQQGEPIRGLSEENAAEILWTPLFVKLPGQEEGLVDDRPAETIDIVPTMADALDVDIPWEVDGQSLLGDGSDDRPARLFDWEFSSLRAEEGDYATVDRSAGFARVLESTGLGSGAAQPYPLHRIPRYGDLVGVPVDELDLGPPDEARFRLTEPPSLAYDPTSGNAPVYLGGEVDGQRDDWLVVAVNDVVGGVARFEATGFGVSGFWGMVPEELLTPGENDFALYRVDGPVESPTLHAIEPEDTG